MPCTICGKPHDEFDEIYRDNKVTPVFFMEYGVCSRKCHTTWIRGRMVFLMIRFMKNLYNDQHGGFEKFVEIFKFDKAGGYAEEKYRKMKENPFLFMLSLSTDKYLLIADHFGGEAEVNY